MCCLRRENRTLVGTQPGRDAQSALIDLACAATVCRPYQCSWHASFAPQKTGRGALLSIDEVFRCYQQASFRDAAEAANPESMVTDRGYGLRVCGLRRHPGMTTRRRLFMTESTVRREEPPVPRATPVLLSFVAGYLDSYTYLSLFGLFAAQVTGSFVIAGAELVTRDYGIAGKLLAIAAFLAAAAATTVLIILARESGRAALPLMLGLEAVLLAVFAAIVLFGPAVADARDWHGIVAGLFAAM